MERATQVDTFGDRRGEVQAAMRDVGYGGFGPGGGGWTEHRKKITFGDSHIVAMTESGLI